MSSGKSRQPSPKSSIPDFAPEDFVIPDLPESDEEPDRTDYEGRLKKIELDRAEGRLLDKNAQKKTVLTLAVCSATNWRGYRQNSPRGCRPKPMSRKMRG